MNIKKKLLVIALAGLLATPAVYAERITDTTANTGTNDDADDVQTVEITVPEIALLNITNNGTEGTVTITVPEDAVTDAGTGFGTYNADETVTYALSSNVASGSANGRTLDVTMAGSLPTGAKLTIESTGASTGTTGDAITHESSPPALESDGDTVTLASEIKNATVTGSELTYTLEPTETNGMMSFTGTDGTTAESITLTYTLSADS